MIDICNAREETSSPIADHSGSRGRYTSIARQDPTVSPIDRGPVRVVAGDRHWSTGDDRVRRARAAGEPTAGRRTGTPRDSDPVHCGRRPQARPGPADGHLSPAPSWIRPPATCWASTAISFPVTPAHSLRAGFVSYAHQRGASDRAGASLVSRSGWGPRTHASRRCAHGSRARGGRCSPARSASRRRGRPTRAFR